MKMSSNVLNIFGRAMVACGAAMLLANAILLQSEPAIASPNGKCCDHAAYRVMQQGTSSCIDPATGECDTTGISGGPKYCEPSGVHTTSWQPGACNAVPRNSSCVLGVS